MDKESKERGWQKIKKIIEQREDVRAQIIWDDMERLILQRELLDKLIEFKELSNKLRSLLEPSEMTDPERELTREGKIFCNRKCCQIYRELTFTTFIQDVFRGFMGSIRGNSPESGEKNLNMVFDFMERYNGFLKQEYDWVQASIAETSPPEG